MQGQKSPASETTSAIPVESSSVRAETAPVPAASYATHSAPVGADAPVAGGVLVAVVVVVAVGELSVGGVAVGVPVGEAVALVGDAGDAQASVLVYGEVRGEADRNSGQAPGWNM